MRSRAAKMLEAQRALGVCARVALLACLAVSPFATTAADTRYRLDAWTSESGLPQNSVNAILQSRDGYLWIATLDGLARFDGVRFTVFNKSNSPGIESNQIISLYEDRGGSLWIGTNAGEVMRYSGGTFTSYARQQGLPSAPIRNISGDDAGGLWVTSENQPLQLLDGRFVPALPADARTTFDSADTGWDSCGVAALDGEALHRFARGRLTTYTVADGLPSLRIRGVDEDQHGDVWVLTEDAGLAMIESGRVARVYTRRDGLPDVEPRAQHSNARLVVSKDRDGNIWIAGACGWLGCLRGGVFTECLPSGPPPGPVRALFEDAEGNIWVGTDGGGILRVRVPAVASYSTPEGLQAGNVYPICEDRSGAVWLGVWNKGVSRVENGAVTNYSMADGLPDPLVTALCQDRDGRLWVGTYAGLCFFDGVRFVASPGPLGPPGRVISAICETRDGAFWCGTDRALYRMDGATTTVYTTENGLAGNNVCVLVEDRGGALWIGTDGGLSRFDGGRLSTYSGPEGGQIGNVRAIYEDDDGAIWIGTYDAGLVRLRNGVPTRYTTHDGLFDNGAFQILEDWRGNLWMSSNRGIYSVSKRQLNAFAEGRERTITSIPYGKSDGMRNIECNGGRWPAGTKTRDGRLWFPTQDGAAIIDPQVVDVNERPPPVVIETCLVDRDPVAFDEPIRIAPGKENFEIQYTGLSFVNSEQVRFRYKLEGLDHDWVDVGRRRTAYFSHVPPGEYTFTVVAANADGVWNTTGASLRFVVVPPFWRTWWFLSLVLGGVVSAAAAWHSHRLARLRRDHAAREEFARRLMESQESERKRIAAELHDSLGQSLAIIKNRALLGLRRPEDAEYAREQLREISEASAEAIDEVKEIAHDLRPYQLDRLGLTRAIEGMIERVADTNDLRFATEIDRIDGLLSSPAEINVFRIVQESLSNVVKHAGATKVDVHVTRTADALEVTVRDDGGGFVSEAPGRDGVEPRGFGLIGMAERARQIGGVYTLRSAPGRGTTMTLTITLEDVKSGS